MTSRLPWILSVFGLVVIFATGGALITSQNKINTSQKPFPVVTIASTPTLIPTLSEVSHSPITIKGTIGCLQPKNKIGPQLLLCAIGLKTSDGRYFSLNFINRSDLTSDKTAGGNEVSVTGTLSPAPQSSPYNSNGTINVTEIIVTSKSTLNNPE